MSQGKTHAYRLHRPNDVNYDIDLGPVLLVGIYPLLSAPSSPSNEHQTDWNHKDYFTLVEETVSFPPNVPVSDNNMINGKGVYDCSLVLDGTACTNLAGLSKFRFTPGKTHRLRIINAGADGVQKFTIDGHKMTVFANDFVPVEPYETNVVTLGIGQRTDVLVTAKGDEDSAIWMRSILSEPCGLGRQPVALAAVYYPEANTSSTPDSVQTEFSETLCGNVS